MYTRGLILLLAAAATPAMGAELPDPDTEIARVGGLVVGGTF